MGGTYYPQLLETRILNDSRVDQSGAADGDVTGWNKNQKIILATQIGYNGKDTAASTYKLQYRDETDSPGGAFGDVGASGEVKYSASSASLSDGTALTQGNSRCTNQDASMTWQNGEENVNDNLLPDSGTFDLGDDCYTEFQWALDLSDADDDHKYTFQLYNITEGAGYECGAQITTAIVGQEVCDSLSEDNHTTQSVMYSGARIKMAQSFTGNGKQLSSCKFYLYKEGTPPGSVTAVLYAHSGTFGTDGVPTGSALATSTAITATDLPTSWDLVRFDFSSSYTLGNGTKYFISVEYDNGDSSNRVWVGRTTTSQHAGNWAEYISSWTYQDYDAIFYVYTWSGFTYIAGGRGTDNGSGTTIDTSDTAFNVTAGDLLVVWVRWDGATTTCSVAETGGGNSFTMESVVANGSTICGVIGYRLSADSASSVQFRATLGASRDYRSIFVMQFRPVSGKTSEVDAGPNPATGSGTAVASGQITTTGTDEVVVGGITDYDYWCDGSQQIGGVAADHILEGSLTSYFGSIFCRILTATASNITASGTQTNSVAWCCDIISIKAEVEAADIPIFMNSYRRRKI